MLYGRVIDVIVEFNWNGVPVNGITRLVSGKPQERVSFRYVVDILSLRDCLLAVAALPANPAFLGIRYSGDLNSLLTFTQEFGTFSVPVSLRYPLPTGATVESLMSVLSLVPDFVRVCIVVPEGWHDLRMVHQISDRFPNVGFCGGSFLKLDGCRYGCLDCYPFKQEGFQFKGCPYMNTTTEECFWVVSDSDPDFQVDYWYGVSDVPFDVSVQVGAGGPDVPAGYPVQSPAGGRVIGSISDLF